MERYVAEFNVNSYLSGKKDKIDEWYLVYLGHTALPSCVKLLEKTGEFNEGYVVKTFNRTLKDLYKYHEEWRRFSMSRWLVLKDLEKAGYSTREFDCLKNAQSKTNADDEN